ncbi:MAG: cobyrinate a,c-diamide synthase [Planctomycetota bacterium]|jgi:cobyrinic acid a,c-diamide synthase
MNVPRIIVAGLRGGSGKTVVSTGLAAAWRKKGLCVSPFKKGPDYIDAAWLTESAGQFCRNLDLFLIEKEVLLDSFLKAAAGSDIAVIEGNRGLFDGMDAEGTYSTAELAKLLEAPVVLAIDCTKSTRTIAALVLGCQKLDPDIPIQGVVLNQVAGKRHESVLRKAVEDTCNIPVVGAVPRIHKKFFPERHLGLVPPQEHDAVSKAIDAVVRVAEDYLDMDTILDMAHKAPAIETKEQPASVSKDAVRAVARIGVFRDAAFQFYYPENLEALENEGGELIEISPLNDTELPDVDALYIGGGFPETLVRELSSNENFRMSVLRRIEKGLPVYAECGGAVFLGEKLVVEGKEYPMAGVFPVTFGFDKKPQGHGYAVLETIEDNPFFPIGESIRGHEFHYTYLKKSSERNDSFAFRVKRGYGFDGRHDGLYRLKVLACYTHIHALGIPGWAPAILREALRFRNGG